MLKISNHEKNDPLMSTILSLLIEYRSLGTSVRDLAENRLKFPTFARSYKHRAKSETKQKLSR